MPSSVASIPSFPDRLWSLRVGAGAIELVIAAWMFSGSLAHALQNGLIATLDKRLPAALHEQLTPSMLQALAWISHLHGTAGILVLSSALGVWLVQRGPWTALPCLVASVPGGLLLNVAVKLAVHRARPEWGYAAEHLASFSFPSGHTAGATMLYAFTVVALWAHASWAGRLALAATGCAAVTIVALSRVALGMHYPSDCLAGIAEGLLWVTICTAGMRAALSGPPFARVQAA